MCGIYGVIHPSGDLSPELALMHQLTRHRGPDCEGIERLPDGVLGHLRLSIIDLSLGGSQPMWDARRQACIVYNGEIYNYRELREECRQAGRDFRSTSDTEVILNHYLEKGPGAFDDLNGIFAFCLYDGRSGEYFLVRDHMGIKPLYWAATPRGLFFASELGALIHSGAVEPKVSLEALQAYLQLDFVPAPMSIIEGVQKLREGHLMRVAARDTEAPRIQKYSTLASATEISERSPAGDLKELGARFRRVIERQLIADVPVGVFLSGGIDSSLVASVAKEVVGGKIDTFSIAFEEPSFDESRYSLEVSRFLGTEHHVQTLTPRALLDIVPSLPRISSEPLADGSIFPTYLLSKFTRGHVKVALSGDGGDELFAGYPTYQAARWASAVSGMPESAKNAMQWSAEKLLPVSEENFSFEFRVKKFLSGMHRDPVLRQIRWLGSFLPEDLTTLFPRFDPAAQDRLEAMLHEPALEADGNPLETLLRTDQRFYLQDGVLVKVDRASMASALEVRVPFLDKEMVAFARGLGSDRKLALREFKVLLKRFAVGRLPESVIGRPKKGFGVPLAKWFRGELRELLRDTLSSHRLSDHGFFNPIEVTRLIDEHESGRYDHRKKLFNLFVFTQWYEDLRTRRENRSQVPEVARAAV